MNLAWGREICGDLATAETREWLCTNGIGGFASGTVPGVLTRRYHGLLVAALEPPLGRTLLVAKVDEQVEYAGLTHPLFANRWADGTVEPSGHADLQEFRLDGTTPVWTYACADALLEKRIFMEPGANTTYVRYRLIRAAGPMDVEIKTLVRGRPGRGCSAPLCWRTCAFMATRRRPGRFSSRWRTTSTTSAWAASPSSSRAIPPSARAGASPKRGACPRRCGHGWRPRASPSGCPGYVPAGSSTMADPAPGEHGQLRNSSVDRAGSSDWAGTTQYGHPDRRLILASPV